MSKYCSFDLIRDGNIRKEKDDWNRILVDDPHDTLMFMYILTPPGKVDGTFRGGFKLTKGTKEYASKTWKLHAPINGNLAIWLVGYLNTTTSLEVAKVYGKVKWDGSIRFGQERMNDWPVPDIEWYLDPANGKVAQTNAYLAWVQANLANKAAFLAGIDAEFAKMIK